MVSNKCLVVLTVIGCCLAAVPAPRENFNAFPVDTAVIYLTKNVEHPITGYVAVQTNPRDMILLSTRQQATYDEASKICRQYKMELIKVDSFNKHRLVREIIKTYTSEGPFWMDGNKVIDGKTWRWSDGSRIMMSFWDNGEPNNARGDEMCIELYHKNALWNDQRCTEKNYFICETRNNNDMQNFNERIIFQNEEKDNNLQKYYYVTQT